MEELIQAVFEALNAEPIRPGGSFTTLEFREAVKEQNGEAIGIKRTRELLRRLKSEGKIKVVSVPQKDLLDRNITVRGWMLVDENET